MQQPADISLADRLSSGTIAFICVLHLVFALAFFFTVLLASQALSQENPVCTGENLVESLAAEAPEKLAAAKVEAAQIPNGKGILWRVDRGGASPSWLFGTMHSADPRISRLEGQVLKAFSGSQTVLIESTESLEQGSMAKTMMELRELTLLMDGSKLEETVAGERVEDLRAVVEARGMPWDIANHMQPWLIVAAIAAPDCELAAKKSGLPVLDTLIGKQALESNKKLIGLETVKEQFEAIASIPREFHVNALNETLRMRHLLDDMNETTKQLYLQGNMGMVLPLARAYAPSVYEGKGHAEFQERVLLKRNRLMVERAVAHLEKGNVFMAVGALHLPGKEGLVELLREAGFTVEPVSG